MDMLDNIDSEEYRKRGVDEGEGDFYEQGGSSAWLSSKCNFQEEREDEDEVSGGHQQIRVRASLLRPKRRRSSILSF